MMALMAEQLAGCWVSALCLVTNLPAGRHSLEQLPSFATQMPQTGCLLSGTIAQGLCLLQGLHAGLHIVVSFSTVSWCLQV